LGKEFILGKMVESMMDNGKITKCKDLENLLGKMEEHI